MASEIATRQLLTIARELESEGVDVTAFLGSLGCDSDLEDQDRRIDWRVYANVMAAAEARWGFTRLFELGSSSVYQPESLEFRDAALMEFDDLGAFLESCFAQEGVFTSVVPCVDTRFVETGPCHYLLEARMQPGFAPSPAHFNYSRGVFVELPRFLCEPRAQVDLDLREDGADFHFHFQRPGLRAFVRRRWLRSKPNPSFMHFIRRTFFELMTQRMALAEESRRRVEAEALLRQAEKMQALGNLTGGIAHDFNNLLTVVMGQLDLMRSTARDVEMIEHIEAALKATERGAGLTQQLLTFARKAPLAVEEIDAGETLSSMRSVLERTLGADVQVVIDAAAARLPVQTDRGRLENALLNLAINARDAMPEGGQVTIRAARLDDTGPDAPAQLKPGRYIRISVSDSGTGMSSDAANQAFEPFFTTKQRGSGTGLGLSMVWGFVTQSGGHATLDSTPGHGTTVTLYLPESTGAVGAVGQSPTHLDPALPEGLRVLLVEDEDGVRDTVAEMLSTLRCDVTSAADAGEAMAMLASGNPIDLILSDVVLPGDFKGPAVAAEYREQQPDLPVLYMTGYVDAQAALGEAAPGPDDVVLAKPFDGKDLARALRSALRLQG